MRSNEFTYLTGQISDLKIHFLPPLDPLAQYTTEQQRSILAFRFLAHAEVETYLEDVCDTLNKDLIRELPLQLVKPVHLWAADASKKSTEAIKSNHGVAEKNIRAMFDPLGFTSESYAEVSSLFLLDMTAFAKKRGDIAHNSSQRISYSVTRQGDEKLVDNVLKHLEAFDALVIKSRLLSFFR